MVVLLFIAIPCTTLVEVVIMLTNTLSSIQKTKIVHLKAIPMRCHWTLHGVHARYQQWKVIGTIPMPTVEFSCVTVHKIHAAAGHMMARDSANFMLKIQTILINLIPITITGKPLLQRNDLSMTFQAHESWNVRWLANNCWWYRW